MNLFSVNGGLLNGGSRLFTVAASAVVACAATVVAVGDRIQDALASSSAQTSVVAAATHMHRSSAQLVGGSSGLKAVAGHQRSANVQIAAGALVRAFVLRALDAAAFVNASADISAIPASVLGRADLQQSAEVAVAATKVQPGRSDKLPASAVIDSAPFVTRFAQADLVGAEATLYVETAINRVDEAYSRLHSGATLWAADAGLVFRPASASMEATGRCSASATHIQPSKANSLSVGSVIDTDTHLIRFGSSLMAGDAVVQADPVRVKQPTVYAVTVVGIEADSQVNHGSAQSLIAPTSTMTALAVRYARVAALVPVEAGAWASGVRCVQPQVLGNAAFAAVDALAQRRVFAVASPVVSVAAMQAAADTTVREAVAALPVHADATAVAVRDAGVAAEVLCLSAGSVDSVRVAMGYSWVEVAADTQADAVRCALATVVGAVSASSVHAVPDMAVREASASLAAVSDVQAQAQRLAMVQSTVVGSVGVEVVGTRQAIGFAYIYPDAHAVSDATRVVLGEASFTPWTTLIVSLDATVREGAAFMAASAGVESTAIRSVLAVADVAVSADVAPQSIRFVCPTATADVLAQAVFDATRVLVSESAISAATAVAVAVADVTVRDGLAFVDGCSGGAVATADRETFAYAALLVDGNVVSDATRTVFAGAELPVAASFEVGAIRAAIAHAQDCTGSAAMTAITTQTQRYGAVAVVADSWVQAIGTRQTNSSSRGYFDMEFHGDAVRTVCPVLDVRCTAVVEPDATRVAFGAAAMVAVGATASAVPDVTVRQGSAWLHGAASELVAYSVRVVRPVATLHASAGVQASGVRVATPCSDAVVVSDLRGEAVRIAHAVVVGWMASADLQANGTRISLPLAVATTVSEVEPIATRLLTPKAELAASAHVLAVPDVTIRECVAFVATSASLQPVAVRCAQPVASIHVAALVAPDPARTTFATAACAVGVAVVLNPTRCVVPVAQAQAAVGIEAVPDVTVRAGAAIANTVATVFPVALRLVQGVADVAVVAGAVPLPTRTTFSAAGFSAGIEVAANASRSVLPDVEFLVQANTTAVPDVTAREAVSAVGTEALVLAAALRTAKVEAAVSVVCDLIADPARITFPVGVAVAGASVVPNATRLSVPVANLPTIASFSGVPDVTVRNGVAHATTAATGNVRPTRVAHGAAVGAARAFFVSVPDVTIRVGQAHAFGGVSVSTNPTATRHSSAHLDVSGEIQVQALRSQTGASEVQVAAHMQADCIANPFSTDPAERTFMRAAATTTFTRSATLTEFRRTA